MRINVYSQELTDEVLLLDEHREPRKSDEPERFRKSAPCFLCGRLTLHALCLSCRAAHVAGYAEAIADVCAWLERGPKKALFRLTESLVADLQSGAAKGASKQ